MLRGYHGGIAALDGPSRRVDIRGVGIAVLGPLELDGTTSSLGLRDRVVLEALAVRPGTVVRAESLAEAIWGESPPPSWPKVVQGCISRLRKVLGGDVIETAEHGYRLRVHVDHLDHLRFERLIGRARELLTIGEPERAAYLLREALDLWRGEPFTELNGWAPGLIELERLVELHRDAEELQVEALLRSGRHDDALAPGMRLLHEAPFRERRWGLLALAQYQGGRQREALDTLHRARAVMVNELGLDPGPDLTALEQAILRQDPSLAVQAALPEPSAVCPYPGLVAYDIGDAGSFFGRESDIATCLGHLDAGGALVIVGASGSGKSSLARAGVAAALERDGRRVRVMTPGRHPMDVLGGLPQRKGDALVVDQCEEVLAPDVDADERTAFLAALADVASRGPLILTLRADRLGEVSRYPAFAHLVERGLHLLGPMETDALRRAIEGPAEQAGLRLEPGLVDLLVREVEGAPGALPLLSHVLRQTWTRREGHTLTVAGYTATGGIQEAVSQSAETVFRKMTARQQGMLRDLMLRLVVPSDSGDPVRTRAPRRSVASDEEREAVIESLVGARLLSSDGDTVEIAHEALALAWPRLRSWLDDDVEGLRIMRHLAVAADSWEELGRPPGELYRGPRQAQAEQWRARSSPSLTPSERDFLDESAALAEAEARATEAQVRLERRSNRRLRYGLAAVAALLAVALVAGVVAVTSQRRAEQEAVAAEQQAKAADARRLGSEALRSTDLDRALLLAVAGTKLDDTPDTQSNLSAVLGRTPQLLDSTRSASIQSMSMSPDGRTIATGSVLTGVRLVDAATLEETATNDSVPVRKVQFAPDGTKLLAAVNPYSPGGWRRVDPIPLRVLDPLTAELTDTQLGGMPDGLTLHETYALSTDGRWLGAAFLHPKYTDNASHVRVWDMRDVTAPVASFTIPFLTNQLAISPDGARVFVTGGDEVHALDVSRGRELRSAPVSDDDLLALTPDGKSLAVARGDAVALLDPESLSVRSVIENEGTVGGDIVVSADGDTIAYAVDDTLVVRPLANPDSAGTQFPTGDRVAPSGIAFAKDERTVYATRNDGLTLAWDAVGDRQLVRPMTLPPRPDPATVQWVRISPDGRTVAYFVTDGSESWAVQFLDVASATWTRRSPFIFSPGFLSDIAWDRGGHLFATAWSDQSVRVWDPRTARLVVEHQVPEDHGVTTAVGLSGDGARVVVGTDEGWVHTFGTSSGRPVGRPVHVGPTMPPDRGVPIFSIDVDTDGGRALASVGGTLHLLDPSGGRVLRSTELGFVMESFARSPVDGTVTVSGGVNLQQGAPNRIATLNPESLEGLPGPANADAVLNLGFSRDGARLLSSSDRVVSLTAMNGRGSLGSLRLGDGGVGGSFVGSAVFTPDESRVLLASYDARIFVWDPAPATASAAACRMAGRDLTDEEWLTVPPRPRAVRGLPAVTKHGCRPVT